MSDGLSVQKHDKDSHEFVSVFYQPAIDSHPFDAKPIEPVDRYEIACVVVELQVIGRSLRRGIIIDSPCPTISPLTVTGTIEIGRRRFLSGTEAGRKISCFEGVSAALRGLANR
jgi:hypothetical protein